MDDRNREYFAEFVEIVLRALREDAFSYDGKFCTFPPRNLRNPYPHSVYVDYGHGVGAEMRIQEIGIAPRPLQMPHTSLYGGFTGHHPSSMREGGEIGSL